MLHTRHVYFLKWRPFDEYPVISSTRLGEQPFLISSFKVASIDTTCVQALKTHSDTLPCTRIVILSHQNIGYPVFFLYRKKNGSIQIPPLRLFFPTCVELDIELEMHALSLFPLPHNQWMHRIEPNCYTLFPNDKRNILNRFKNYYYPLRTMLPTEILPKIARIKRREEFSKGKLYDDQ